MVDLFAVDHVAGVPQVEDVDIDRRQIVAIGEPSSKPTAWSPPCDGDRRRTCHPICRRRAQPSRYASLISSKLTAHRSEERPTSCCCVVMPVPFGESPGRSRDFTVGAAGFSARLPEGDLDPPTG